MMKIAKDALLLIILQTVVFGLVQTITRQDQKNDYNEFGHNAGEIYEIYFCCGGFRLKPKYSKARGYWFEDDRTVEVIGNIHDNPELLEVTE